MQTAIAGIDAFTDRVFGGNPAAVCVLPGVRDELWMQALAAEMNLSETAFVRALDGAWELRWFTPRVEVDLCGHATLASAHLLWEDARLSRDVAARFETRSGTLTCRRRDGWIEMDFPATPAAAAPLPPELARAVGARPVWSGRTVFDWLVEVDSEETLRRLAPDFPVLAGVAARGLIVTSRPAAPGVDFVSRYFAPAFGIDEDPVTGSAHCALGPYWAERLGRDELVGRQASSRGGVVRVRPRGARVTLLGKAVTVWRGTLAEDGGPRDP